MKSTLPTSHPRSRLQFSSPFGPSPLQDQGPIAGLHPSAIKKVPPTLCPPPCPLGPHIFSSLSFMSAFVATCTSLALLPLHASSLFSLHFTAISYSWSLEPMRPVVPRGRSGGAALALGQVESSQHSLGQHFYRFRIATVQPWCKYVVVRPFETSISFVQSLS